MRTSGAVQGDVGAAEGKGVRGEQAAGELREGWPPGPPSQMASRVALSEPRAESRGWGAGGLGVTPCDPILVTKEGARPPASGGVHVYTGRPPRVQ